jgi:hypothetical protein
MQATESANAEGQHGLWQHPVGDAHDAGVYADWVPKSRPIRFEHLGNSACDLSWILSVNAYSLGHTFQGGCHSFIDTVRGTDTYKVFPDIGAKGARLYATYVDAEWLDFVR